MCVLGSTFLGKLPYPQTGVLKNRVSKSGGPNRRQSWASTKFSMWRLGLKLAGMMENKPHAAGPNIVPV